MSLLHVTLGKMCIAIIGVSSAIVLINPTVQVAAITGGCTVAAICISGGFAMMMRRWDRRDHLADRLADEERRKADHVELLENQKQVQAVVDDVKHQTDGIRTRMEQKVEQAEVKAGEQTADLSAARTRADHAEGYREGSDKERDQDKP